MRVTRTKILLHVVCAGSCISDTAETQEAMAYMGTIRLDMPRGGLIIDGQKLPMHRVYSVVYGDCHCRVSTGVTTRGRR